MQRFLLPLRPMPRSSLQTMALVGVMLLASQSAFAEDAPQPETSPVEQPIVLDSRLCTTQANEQAQAHAEASETGGDAQALFYACMSQKGYTPEALEAIEEEQ